MTEVKWIKLLTGMFDDEKIKLIENIPEADMILIIWIKLLTLAGKKNVNGYIFLTENIPYTDEMLATIFNRPLNTIRLALETFKKFGMISLDENEIMYITNWEKHQNIEGLEKIREQNRLRQRKFQEEHKKLPKPKKGNNVSITLDNATDKKRLDKKRLEKEKNSIEYIYSRWNEQKIIVHKNIDDYKSAIKIAIKKYGEGEVGQAIINYDIILKGKEYYFKYRWTLNDFLKRGVDKFIDLEIAKNNYNKGTTKQSVDNKPAKEKENKYSEIKDNMPLLTEHLRKGE